MNTVNPRVRDKFERAAEYLNRYNIPAEVDTHGYYTLTVENLEFDAHYSRSGEVFYSTESDLSEDTDEHIVIHADRSWNAVELETRLCTFVERIWSLHFPDELCPMVEWRRLEMELVDPNENDDDYDDEE